MKKAMHLDPIPSKKKIHEFYDDVASGEGYQAAMYSATHRKQTRASVEQLLSVILPLTPRVLEIGCADGMISRWIAPRVDKLVGLEIVPACIGRCEALGLEGAEFHLTDVERATDWPKGGFDLVLAMDVIEHLRDPYKFMERARVAGGILLVTTPINEFPNADAFSVEAFHAPRKNGDGSAHIWCFRENTFRALFDEIWHYEDNGITAIVMGR
jgi:2-polyprenyl-3-methyl-5-hydroxy-6-metoxy-1,4-benzoquinol methylase